MRKPSLTLSLALLLLLTGCASELVVPYHPVRVQPDPPQEHHYQPVPPPSRP